MVLVPPLRISLRNFEIGEENIMVREKKFISISENHNDWLEKNVHINDGMILPRMA